MPTNFRQFVAEIDAEGPQQLDKDFNKFMRLQGLTLLRGAIFGAPVGNPKLWKRQTAPKGYVGGSFRGSIITTLGRPSEEVRNRPDPSGARTLAEGSRVIAKYRNFQSIWIASNLPYSARIEDGWSRRQAPKGVFRVALARVAVRFRRVV